MMSHVSLGEIAYQAMRSRLESMGKCEAGGVYSGKDASALRLAVRCLDDARSILRHVETLRFGDVTVYRHEDGWRVRDRQGTEVLPLERTEPRRFEVSLAEAIVVAKAKAMGGAA